MEARRVLQLHVGLDYEVREGISALLEGATHATPYVHSNYYIGKNKLNFVGKQSIKYRLYIQRLKVSNKVSKNHENSCDKIFLKCQL